MECFSIGKYQFLWEHLNFDQSFLFLGGGGGGGRILENQAFPGGYLLPLLFEMSTEGDCGMGKAGMKGDVGIKPRLRADHGALQK